MLLGRRKKILLVRLINRNYGDTIIADNTAYLIRKALGSRAEIFDYDLRSGDVFQVRFCDAVVFAGGGLIKFKGEDFERYISEIIKAADEFAIPVFFNSVGVEGYDGENEICMALKRSVNRPCVKGISVRDDTETLISSYLQSEIRVRSVVDSAVWSSKTYRDVHPVKEGYIGIGIARELLFSDYGHTEIDSEYLMSYWCGLISAVENKGYKWRIFTNGLNSDEEFAERVLAAVGHGEKARQPMSAKELVETIASFDGVIAQRMHSCIIAYSFGIPAVGLVWNDKMRFWGERIGCPHRFVLPEELTSERTIEAFDNSMSDELGKPDRSVKTGVYKELKRFLGKVGKNAEYIDSSVDYNKRLAAAALGAIGKKFKNTNTLEAFEESLSAGFCMFETDVRATAEGIAVCINGWNRDTFGKLRIEFSDELKKGLSASEFSRSRYYNRYKTITFDELAKAFAEKAAENDIRLVIDIGRPPADMSEKLIDSIVQSIKTHNIAPDRIMIRAQRERDVELIEKTELNCVIAYFLPVGKDQEDKEKKFKAVVSCCKRHGIEILSMTPDAFDNGCAERCRKHRIKPFILSYTKAEDIFYAFENGAAFAGSHFVSPKYMHKLLK